MENIVSIADMPTFCPEDATYLLMKLRHRFLPIVDKCSIFVFHGRLPKEQDIDELSSRKGSILCVWECPTCGKASVKFRHASKSERNFYSGCTCPVSMGDSKPE